jgi:guanyl-specific ribonuclease Sa
MTTGFLSLSPAGVALLLTVFAAAAQPQGRAAPDPDIPLVRVSDLPTEARQTLALIRAGGPFPHARDGSVFANGRDCCRAPGAAPIANTPS